MIPGTDFYGINKIIMDHAGLPRLLPLPVAVQHGWLRQPTGFESQLAPPEVWLWSERTAIAHRAMFPYVPVRIVGAPFAYFLAQVRNTLPDRVPVGSIAIPMHSSHFVKARFSAEEFADELRSLPEEFHPVTVMLYYLDMTPDNVAAYERRGFSVVTNGSLFSPLFLHKFVANVHGKRFCIFNDFGSGVLYCAHMGLTPVQQGGTTQFYDVGDPHASEQIHAGLRDFDKPFLARLGAGELSRLVREELGLDHLLSPAIARRLILRSYSPRIISRILSLMARKQRDKLLRRALP